MAQALFSTLETFFDRSFGPDLLTAAEDATYEELRDLQERVKGLAKSAKAPPAQAGHLRPYVPLELHSFQRVAHGLYLRADDFADPGNAEIALNALKHHLLYCDSLAIDDPLRWILDAFIVSPKPYLIDYLERSRARLFNFLRFLILIEPLVREDVVVLVENDITEATQKIRLLSDPAAVAGTADFSDLPAPEQSLLANEMELTSQALVLHAESQLTRGLEAMTASPGTLDLYLPYRHYEAVLRSVGNMRPELVPEWARDMELRMLSNLLQVSLPRLSRLEPKEIVAVRQGEGAFAQWRAALERGIERVEGLDAETLSPDAEAVRLIERELIEGRQSLEAELDASSFLSQAKQGTKDFAIGSIVALGLIPLAGPIPAIVSTAGTLGLKLLLSSLAGRSADQASARALQHHYLLFSPDSR